MSIGGWSGGVLGQADSSLFVLLGLIIVVLVGMFLVVMWVRRRLSPHEDFHGEGFTLGDLRRLHKAGQLSDDEFEKAKQGLIAAAHAAEQRKEQEKRNLREMGWDSSSRR